MAFRSKICRLAKTLSSPRGPRFPRKALIRFITFLFAMRQLGRIEGERGLTRFLPNREERGFGWFKKQSEVRSSANARESRFLVAALLGMTILVWRGCQAYPRRITFGSHSASNLLEDCAEQLLLSRGIIGLKARSGGKTEFGYEVPALAIIGCVVHLRFDACKLWANRHSGQPASPGQRSRRPCAER